jgi:hypothetical protein
MSWVITRKLLSLTSVDVGDGFYNKNSIYVTKWKGIYVGWDNGLVLNMVQYGDHACSKKKLIV